MGESGGNEILMRIGRKHIKHNILTHFKNLALEESSLSIPSDLILHYVINTLWTLTTWWLDDGLRHTPEEMDAMFNGLVMPGAWQALGIHSNN